MTTTTIDTNTGELTEAHDPHGKDQVATAFVAAQADFGHVVENAHVQVGGGNRAGYATLPKVMETLRPILNRHGLALMQPAVPAQGGVRVRTMLLHTSGQSILDDGVFIPAARTDPQGYGSALSYARRYGILSMLGVATDDDDGQAAMQGFARERHEQAKAAARAAERVDERQAETLVAVARTLNPDTEVEKLRVRYAAVLADDFEATLDTGLEAARKRKALTAKQVGAVQAAVQAGEPVEAIVAIVDGSAS